MTWRRVDPSSHAPNSLENIDDLESGESFTIGPTATKLSKNWLEMAKRNQGIAYHSLLAYYRITGARLSEPVEFDKLLSSAGPNGKVPVLLQSFRPEFHTMLLEELQHVVVELEYTEEIVEYLGEQEKGTAATVAMDGSMYSADVIIAADGIRGSSQSLIAGQPIRARSAGDAIFRVTSPVEHAIADPIIAERFQLTENGRSVLEHWRG